MSSSPPTITVTGAHSPQIPPHYASAMPSPAPPAMTPSAETAAPTPETQAPSTPAVADLGPDSASAPAAAPLMPRSCVICRSRKVRCSRENPCANCRRAGIPCIFPSNDRPPRWARRLDRTGFPAVVAAAAAGVNPGAKDGAAAPSPAPAQVMERVHNLENLVKELRSQLDQAHAATAAATASAAGTTHVATGSSTAGTSPGSTANTEGSSAAAATSHIQEQFGRLVVSDDKHSLYVSSGFWSRVNDELDGLKMETQGLALEEADTSEEEGSPGKSPTSPDYERTPSERHAFVFRHNLNPTAPDSSAFQPLPYEVSYLVDVFAENINALAQIVHMPTTRKLVRNMRAGSHAALTPANEALMFSIYYAAITAMEEEDISTNFKSGKAELCLKYRLGFEHALAKADFLHVSDIVLVQALCNFLLVGRRHDSPSFIWMMTGIAIRMGQALGLHRDPANFDNLTPYEVEIRRRVWWVLCVLDARSSEDQRANLTITPGSFDTKMPLNLNDSDIDPESKQIPIEREGITDVTFARISFQLCDITQRIIALGAKDEGSPLEEQTRLLNEMHESLQRIYVQHSSDPGHIYIWGWSVVVRITVAKMTLITHLPVLFSSSNENFSEDIRNKLLVTAIELAEHNHAVSDEPRCRQWRWIIQTYTHWHAIVFLLIEMARRPWSPIIERAWEALRSPWLIPNQQFSIDKNLRVWMPLRKLMTTVRRHREAELAGLRADPWAARELEVADGNFPVPRTAIEGAAAETVNRFREKWRRLVRLQDKASDEMQRGGVYQTQGGQSWMTNQPVVLDGTQQTAGGTADQQGVPNMAAQFPAGQDMINYPPGQVFGAPFDMTGGFDLNQQANSLQAGIPVSPALSDLGNGVLGWLWSGTDPASDMFANVNMDAVDMNMDLEGEMDWSRWLESAQGMEMDTGHHAPAWVSSLERSFWILFCLCNVRILQFDIAEAEIAIKFGELEHSLLPKQLNERQEQEHISSPPPHQRTFDPRLDVLFSSNDCSDMLMYKLHKYQPVETSMNRGDSEMAESAPCEREREDLFDAFEKEEGCAVLSKAICSPQDLDKWELQRCFEILHACGTTTDPEATRKMTRQSINSFLEAVFRNWTSNTEEESGEPCLDLPVEVEVEAGRICNGNIWHQDHQSCVASGTCSSTVMVRARLSTNPANLTVEFSTTDQDQSGGSGGKTSPLMRADVRWAAGWPEDLRQSLHGRVFGRVRRYNKLLAIWHTRRIVKGWAKGSLSMGPEPGRMAFLRPEVVDSALRLLGMGGQGLA